MWKRECVVVDGGGVAMTAGYDLRAVAAVGNRGVGGAIEKNVRRAAAAFVAEAAPVVPIGNCPADAAAVGREMSRDSAGIRDQFEVGTRANRRSDHLTPAEPPGHEYRIF